MIGDDIAIKVSNVFKCYQIYNQPHDRLKQFIIPKLCRIFPSPSGVCATPHSPLPTFYKEFWALKDVSFETKKGETVGIIGHNGSGKSTLLQIISGTLRPTSGSVQTNGRIGAILELGSGFNHEFTGRENIYMSAAVLGLSKEETGACFDDIVAFADIGDFIEQPIKTYSTGMLVRLAFAVQASIEPDILIVDEALAVGDEKFQRKCFARLEELKRCGTSIIFVSHSGSQLIELCDRAILLDHGVRLMCAKPAEVLRAYHKLIYAPQEDQAKLVKEYQDADSKAGSDDLQKEAVSLATSVEVGTDLFDPGLVPETTTTYPLQGAEIQSIQIADEGGRIVNVLRPGCEYQFILSGQFLSNINGAYFGIHIRSVSGLVVTGQRYPEEGRYVESLSAGNKFRVVFGFKMVLLPGVYFVGGGVWSSQEPTCCHRVLDMLMFRLNSEPKSNSFGYVDACTKEPHVELI